jgi:hypothetical protein
MAGRRCIRSLQKEGLQVGGALITALPPDVRKGSAFPGQNQLES